ncbi:MAG: hypothetical protein PHI98_03185 [Eubacteriales bacterium]|nr:hypothetical protein [Eubacteriales bacterium]
MTTFNFPATLDDEFLPTPSLPGDEPAAPGQGPEGLPTPSLPGNEPAAPSPGPEGLPTPSLPGQSTAFRCPVGYSAGTVLDNQTFTDLLLQNNVSYQAMRSANPSLPTTRIAPGTRYCAPPSGSRRLCIAGSTSYVMGVNESLNSLSRLTGLSPGVLLWYNPSLAPSDFVPGRVICLP